MNILVTGNLGYVGAVLVPHLRARFPECRITGFDTGYFGHCLTAAPVLPEAHCDTQVFGDVRELPDALLRDCDAVVHLAAISNDPMGARFEQVTGAINLDASVAIARRAAALGVGRFVFASSCSMYGYAEGGPRTERDALNPLTAYARSKVGTEQALAALEASGMVVTSLRFATACGMSGRLRLDLVLNDFVAGAVAARQVTVLSDGTPWRPLIDVRDMARAIEWALVRDPAEAGALVAVNVGSDEWNHQVRDLAHAVAAAVPGTKVSINADAPPDRRSYRVDFSLYRRIAPDHQPLATLADSIERLREGLEAMAFSDAGFRQSQFMRLKVLEQHMAAGRLDEALRWRRPG